ncbi:MAG TPA: hypothetical protein VFM87_10580 [Agrococcus sp.]|nr:hypothetical protein [Agrococcus sp.]
MIRSTIGALAVMAAIVLTACAAGSAPEPGTASDPPVASETVPAVESVPATETPVASEQPAAEPRVDRQACEAVVQERYQANSPRLATPEDYAATEAALGFELPAEPTCGVVSVPDSGVGTHTLHIYVDQPTVAAALTDALAQQGWTMTQEQAPGYMLDVYTEGDVTAALAAVGVDNAVSPWGELWPGMDVTMLRLEVP